MTGWTEEGLLWAWRALARQEAAEDWRFIHLARVGSISAEAGCHFPLGREALIASFPGSLALDADRLPQGKGFDVTLISGQEAFDGRTAIAIVRRMEGSAEIFTVMVIDILRSLENAIGQNCQESLETFLGRVLEWQAFMARAHRPLSSEAQIGLFGELWLLRALLDSNLGADALDCWQGPLRAAQDFHILNGAIEVKSTTQSSGFVSRINSIEQLDSCRKPLFLCGLRFSEDIQGRSLAELVSDLRGRFEPLGLDRRFDALLTVMGFIEEHAHFYGRRLTLAESRAFRVEGDMPRLIRINVPAAIRSASYVLDIGSVDRPFVDLPTMISEFGLA